MAVCGFTECRIGVARQRNQIVSVTFEKRNELDHLISLTGIGNSDEHVICSDHAQITVIGLARVHEKARGSGTRESGGNLFTYNSRLAHPADNNAPLGDQHLLNNLTESTVQFAAHMPDSLRFYIEHLPGDIQIVHLVHSQPPVMIWRTLSASSGVSTP
ncbi:hypothetical protein D3C81_1689590 [compost metagenome]